ncbi:bifunctional metallophosphatase/5'-nucleotidase [Shewanella halotolerans]|uniref:bifunctional metallophosphatase/5'-nucleotidase n=1 Tax=Shewanella halotolerans TaxID=2864204 RepID=UPI001C660F3E|nr:5'-nucleotidase C-terminal domain-containing protein [Shewanella halotolerans]QYJ88819.1 5'-nucleotidase C-terminal domain-containing protein [Shewanella halotolerans]
MTNRYPLKLAHINDTHSHFDPSRVQFLLTHEQQSYEVYSHSGGYARIDYQVQQARQQAADAGQDFLFLHGGDSFQGTLYFNQFKGVANADLLNRLAPDAMVLGNHEIDAGNQPVKRFLDTINFPLLAGNMDLSLEDPLKQDRLAGHPKLFDYIPERQMAKVLLKPLGDKQIAIIGITLDQMKEIARPDEDTHFANAIATTANTVAKLKADGIDHILVLSHLGWDKDKELAREVPGISLIVGGHSHTLQGDFSAIGINALPYGYRVEDTPVLHAGKYAETLGLCDIEFDDKGRVTKLAGHNYFMLDEHLIIEGEQEVTAATYNALKQQLMSHPGVLWNEGLWDEELSEINQVIAQRYRPAIDALEHQVLGFVPKNLIHTRLPSKALPHGSEIAPWVCKSIYHETRRLDLQVDFALHNAGGVRQSLNKGTVTMADVLGRLLPFALPLVKYRILGRYLYQTLESAINSATNNSITGTGAGSFPYTYGLKYCYDGRQPLGTRILQLEILTEIAGEMQWHSVMPDRMYSGVSSAYTASGKEGYQDLLRAEQQESIEALTLPQAFILYMQREEGLHGIMPPHVLYTSHLEGL